MQTATAAVMGGPRVPAPGAARAAGGAGAAGMAGAVGAPPFVLPGEHFGAALVFLVLGALGLVVIAPELAQGAYISPRVAGVTHLFTLGWITTSIMGALYQFLPVALGQPIRSQRAAHATFVLFVIGVPLFVTGLVRFETGVMLVGAVLFGSGVLCFVGNLSASLRRASRRDVTWWALAFATLYLAVTLVLGLALAGNLRWGYLGGGRAGAMGVHLHVALAGWVLLVMIGVAHRLLPMFLLSHGAGDRFAKWAVGLVAAGAGVLAVLHHAPSLFSRWIPAVLIAAGCASFLFQARAFYAHRHRPVLDPGMRLAAAALSIIGVALVLAWPVMVTGVHARIATAYILSAILGITLFVAAHYYKIVPFLVWYHRFGPLAGRQPVPRVNELYSARAARLAGAVLVTAAVGLIGSVATGAAGAARVSAMLLVSGVAIETVQMILLMRRHP